MRARCSREIECGIDRRANKRKKREVEDIFPCLILAIPYTRCSISARSVVGRRCEERVSRRERYVISKQTVGQFLASMNTLYECKRLEKTGKIPFEKKTTKFSCHLSRAEPRSGSSCVLWWCQCDSPDSKVCWVWLFHSTHNIYFLFSFFITFLSLGVGFLFFQSVTQNNRKLFSTAIWPLHFMVNSEHEQQNKVL